MKDGEDSKEGLDSDSGLGRTKEKGFLGWVLRVSAVFFLVLIAFLVWFNGPGMRWLGPKLADYFLEKDGAKIQLRLGGTLLGGVNIYDLDFKAEGSIGHLVVDRLETDYRFREVIRGKVRGISGEGIHLDFRMLDKDELEEEKAPVDFEVLGRALNGVRERVLPLNLDLEDLSVSVEKEEVQVFSLAGGSISHEAGSDVVILNLGVVKDAEGRALRTQEAEIVWGPETLTLKRLDLLPFVGLRDVRAFLPESGLFTLRGDLRLLGAVLRLDVGEAVEDVSLELVRGELNFGRLLGGFGIGRGMGFGLPIQGVLEDFSLELREVFPEWQAAVGTAEIAVRDFAWDGWEVAELSVGLTLDDGEVGARVSGKAFDSDFSIDGRGEFERQKVLDQGFFLDGLAGDVRIGRLDEVLRGLDAKMDWGVDVKDFPRSVIGGEWDLVLGEGGFSGVGLDVTMKAEDFPEADVRLAAKYELGKVTVSALEAVGLEISGKYFLDGNSYEGGVLAKDFDTRAVEPWLKGLGVELPGAGIFNMEWKGSGGLAAKTHEGDLDGLEARWDWKATEGEVAKPSIVASGEIDYDWPVVVRVEGLEVRTQGQKVVLDAVLEENELDLSRLRWTEGEETLAEGSGVLPMPEDFAKFGEFMANDSRSLDFKIVTETLSLSKLELWVGQVAQLDKEATGKLDLQVGGTFASPELGLNVELRDVRVPEQPNIPQTDLTLEITASDGVAKISAEAITADYAPATFKAKMPFFPKKWAENPKLLKEEAIEGRLDLPRVDLSRFQALIPNAEELGGVVNGQMTVSGTLGDPEVNGELDLAGGKFRVKGNTVPPLEGLNIQVDTDLDRVNLRGEVKDMAGGDLRMEGSLGLKNVDGEGLGEVDFDLRANGVPLVRNEFLIMRANIDLQVKGPMDGARISGEVGILDSVFYKDMELIPIGKPFLEPSAAKLPAVDAPNELGSAIPAPFDQWTANVVVKTIDPILLRGNLGTGKVDVALRVEGELRDPKPNGKVRVSEVVARLPFTTLRIDEGFLTFTPTTGFDPILEIRGTSEPRPYRVEVFAYGRASDPQLVLNSEPPLPENEIMTLLATGTTTSGLEDSQAASSRATQLLIEELRRGRFLFGKQLRPILGLLDNVDFSLAESNPYDSAAYNSATMKLSEKWYLSAGLGEDGEQRVLAIWRLKFR